MSHVGVNSNELFNYSTFHTADSKLEEEGGRNNLIQHASSKGKRGWFPPTLHYANLMVVERMCPVSKNVPPTAKALPKVVVGGRGFLRKIKTALFYICFFFKCIVY